MGNREAGEGSSCESSGRRKFIVGLAALAGLPVIGAVSGCVSSRASAVVDGEMIEDEIADVKYCEGKLADSVREILGDAKSVKNASDLDRVCRRGFRKDLSAYEFSDQVRDMLSPDGLATVRIGENLEVDADGKIAEAKSLVPSQEDVDTISRTVNFAGESYAKQKSTVTHQKLIEVSLSVRRAMDSLEKQMENVKEAMRNYLSIATAYMQLTSSSGDFEQYKLCKLADLHRKVRGSIDVYGVLASSYFVLKTVLPDGKILLEEPPIDSRPSLDLDSELDDE